MRVFTPLFAGVCLLLGACAGLPHRGGPGGGNFEAGDNLVQEACRAEAAPLDERLAAAGLTARQYDIYCGKWERPSGRVLRLDDGTTAADQLATSGPWAEALDEVAACQPPTATAILADTTATALDCRLRSGGWPYSGLAAGIDGTTYLADGIPSTLPALERAVAVLAGRAAAVSAEPSAAVQRIQDNMAGHLFGTGDLDAFQNLMRAGSYYNGIRSFAEAEAAYRQALEIHERVLGTSDPSYGDPLMHLALEVSNQERFLVADQLFAEAEPLIDASPEPADRARLISYRALHAANQRHYDEALELARQATALRRQIAGQAAGLNETGNRAQYYGAAIANLSSSAPVLQTSSSVAAIDTAQSLSAEAAMLLKLGKAEDARRTIDEAMALVDASTGSPEFWRPQLLLRSAEVDTALGDLGAAERSVRFALAQLEQLRPGTRPVALAWMQLGGILAKQERADDAIDAYDHGLAIFRDRDYGLRPEAIDGYLNLLYARLQTGADVAGKMFDAAQLARGVVVSQTISDATARLSSSDQAVGAVIRDLQDARRQRDGLLFKFNSLAARATTSEDRKALDDLRQQVQQVETRIGELEPQVQAAAPTLNMLRDKAATLAEVAPAVRGDEALLQILVAPSESFAFLVRGGAVKVVKIDVEERILSAAVTKLKDAFVVRKKSIGAFDVKLAHLLYTRLVAPFEGELQGVNRLVVVPSGPLLGLPLGVLVAEPPPKINGPDYSAVSFLAARTGLVTAPSTRAFVDLRQKAGASPAARPFLGFGDFVPSGDPGPLLASRGLPDSCRPSALAVANAPRLHGTAPQVEAMARAVGADSGSVVLGDAFNEAQLRSLPLQDYRVLVLATHGLLPGQLDCLWEPSLVVSRPADAPAEDDGLLSYDEILDLKLNADLVVLSACNTGGPLSQSQGTEGNVEVNVRREQAADDTGEADRDRGESLAGLARAFFYAGARSLLVSNWEVSADATIALMSETFARMGGGSDVASALQAAQRELMANPRQSHPYYWASFVIVGDGTAGVHEPAS